MAGEAIEIRVARLRRDPEGFVWVTILPEARLEIEDAVAIIDTTAELGGGGKVASLADIRQIKAVTRQARLYFVGEAAARTIRAQAVLVGSPLSKVIGNFYGLYGVPYPLRLFTDEERAVTWLRGHLQ
jgi:hypothetical protein